ncbi:MAG: hypothetical protein FWE31_06040 [Firmicutes bacterium]|nr:hypothetical protein [Bacillota bacterium]
MPAPALAALIPPLKTALVAASPYIKTAAMSAIPHAVDFIAQKCKFGTIESGDGTLNPFVSYSNDELGIKGGINYDEEKGVSVEAGIESLGIDKIGIEKNERGKYHPKIQADYLQMAKGIFSIIEQMRGKNTNQEVELGALA